MQDPTPPTPPTPPSATPTPPQPPQLPPPATTQKKRSIWVWLGPVLAGVALLFVIIGLIIWTAYGGVAARMTAQQYMQAVQDGDAATIKKLSGADYNDYLKNATNGLKGATFKSKTSDYSKDSETYRIAFDVTKSTSIKDTAVYVNNGQVVKFNLNVNGKSTANEHPSQTPSQSTPQPEPATTCLTADIVKQATTSGYAPNPYKPSGYQTSLTMFFEPDSSVYVADFTSQQNTDLDKLGSWTKQHAAKKFHIEITAKVQQAGLTDDGAALATQRAQKVQQDLLSRGAPADKIRIMPHQAEPGNDENAQQSRRNVNVTIMGDC